MKGQFVDLYASADYLGPGAIEINRYQTEIFDIVRRRGVFGQRIKQVPATGHPSRFFEETAINAPTAAQAFVDPRNIVPTVGSPTRLELAVPLKALVSQLNYNLFDLEVTAQQSQFAYLQAKDLADSVDGLLRTHDVALWNGNDTSFSSPTTTQYFGGFNRQGNEGGIQRGAQYRGSHCRIASEGADDTGWRAAVDSGLDDSLHRGITGNVSGVRGDRGFDRVSLVERSQSAGVQAGTAERVDAADGSGEVWRTCGEGGELCALSGERAAVGNRRWSLVANGWSSPANYLRLTTNGILFS